MAGTTPAGWYPDPEGRAPARWWDGVWWSAWESDGARQWIGSPTGPARRPNAQDLPALTFVRTILLPEARRRGALDGPQGDALATLTDRLAAELAGPHGAPAVALTPTGPPAATTAPAPSPAPRASAPAPQPAAAPQPAPALAQAPTGIPASALPPPQTPIGTYAPVPRTQNRLARWWAASRLRLDTDLTVHGLTYLGVLLLFVGVFGLVAFAFGDVEPGLRPVAEIAVAVVPFAAAGLLARSGARFVARAMIAVGGLILPVMVVTATVDGFHVPPDLRGLALPVGAGLACAAIAVAYAVRVWRRPDSALGVMVAPVAWFAAGMGAVALGRPVPSGENVAVPGAAQVAVIALAVLVTTWLAGRNPRAALATGALAAAPAGVVVTAALALVSWTAEGWPLVPVLVTTPALALAVRRLAPTRGGDVLAAAWLVVTVRVLAIDGATPVLSEHVALPGTALDARPALLLATLLAGAGLLELLVRRAGASAVAFAVLGWAVALVAVLGAVHTAGAWWGVAGVVALAAWAPVRRVSPPPLPGAGVALDAIAVVSPIAVVAGVWQHLGGQTAGILTAGLALAVTPLARGRLRRRPGDRLWEAWWAGAVAVTVVASAALAVDGLLTSGSGAERAVVPTMLALVVAALVAGPGSRVRVVLLATPAVWALWAAVVETSGWGQGVRALGFAVLGLGAVVVAHVARPAPTSGSGPAPIDAPSDFASSGRARASRRAPLTVAATGLVTGVVAVRDAADARALAAALGLGTLAWLVTAVLGDRGRSPVGAVTDRAGALRSLPWVVTLVGVPVTAVAALDANDVVPMNDPWWIVSLVVAALGYAAATRARTPGRLRPALPWSAFAFAVLAVLAALGLVLERTLVGWPALDERSGWPAVGEPGGWPLVAALAALVLVAPLVHGRHPVLVWTAWLALAPLAGVTAWTGFTAVRDLGGEVVAAGALISAGGLLAVGALLADRLLVDRTDPHWPRALPRRRAASPPYMVGVGQLAIGAIGALALPLSTLDPYAGRIVLGDPGTATTSGVLLLAAAVLTGAIAGLGGVGAIGAVAVLLAWVGTRVLLADAYAGAWVDVGVVGLLLAAALATSLVRTPEPRWARWDVPLSVTAVLPALSALAVAGPGERSAVSVVIGGFAIGAAVRLARRRATSETLATVGSTLVLLGAVWASRGWAVGALAGLAAAHTTLAALRESGGWRTARQWVGAILAAAAWLVFVGGPTVFGGNDQLRVDATAVGAALVTVGAIGAGAAGRLDRSWSVPWGAVGTLLAVGAGLTPVLGQAQESSPPWVAVGWWQVVAWVLLALAAALAGQLMSGSHDARAWRTRWRVIAVAPVLAALLAGLTAAPANSFTRVVVLTLVSLVTAVVVVVAARAGTRGLELPLVVLGVATLVLGAGFALAAERVVGPGGQGVPRSTLLAVVLAVAAVQAAAYGVALRVLGLRLSAPVLAWLAWVVFALDALGDVVVWYTVPVGLAMIAVVGVWRADRRRRGLPASEPAVAALDLAGIAFLVVASFAAAFTQSVWHALVAAGIGVLVFFWAVLTRVRRRLLAGAVIVLAGLVIAVVLPLVALVPAWGGAALWVAVAVVGLLVVLAATFLERGRAALVGGRARLRTATTGWE